MMTHTANDPSRLDRSSSGSLEIAAPSREGAGPKSVLPPDPEVPATKRRRRFTVQYKLRILTEADSCTEQGQIGALLRREGLYSSSLALWRRQREEGTLRELGQKRGRKPNKDNRDQKRIEELERENAKLRDQLEKAETIIEFQKKISKILGIPQDSNEKGGKGS
jgi:transposase-like protein